MTAMAATRTAPSEPELFKKALFYLSAETQKSLTKVSISDWMKDNFNCYPSTTLVNSIFHTLVNPNDDGSEGYKPYPTTGDGNCSFHALFGTWNGTEYSLIQAQEKRLLMCAQLREAVVSHRRKKEILKLIDIILEDWYHHPSIAEYRFLRHKSVRKAFTNGTLNTSNSSVFDAYLEVLKSQFYYLHLEELEIAAILFDLQVLLYITNYKDTKSPPQLYKKMNPEGHFTITVYFSNRHYRRYAKKEDVEGMEEDSDDTSEEL